MTIELHVAGLPAAQGSKTLGKTTTGQPYIREANRNLAPWRATLAHAAQQAMHERPPLSGPIALEAVFRFPRPQAHYRTGRFAGQLRDSASLFHAGRPDLDKLLRALGDALTGIIWHDDAQIALIQARKRYGSPGLNLTVRPLEDP